MMPVAMSAELEAVRRELEKERATVDNLKREAEERMATDLERSPRLVQIRPPQRQIQIEEEEEEGPTISPPRMCSEGCRNFAKAMPHSWRKLSPCADCIL